MPVAISLLIVGIILLLFGLGSADSIQNAFSRIFTGHSTDRTVWLIVGGSICALAGLVGCYRNRRI